MWKSNMEETLHRNQTVWVVRKSPLMLIVALSLLRRRLPLHKPIVWIGNDDHRWRMKRKCGGANMGGDKWLSTVDDENGGRRSRCSGIVEMVCSWLWLTQPTVTMRDGIVKMERWESERERNKERKKKWGRER